MSSSTSFSICWIRLAFSPLCLRSWLAFKTSSNVPDAPCASFQPGDFTRLRNSSSEYLFAMGYLVCSWRTLTSNRGFYERLRRSAQFRRFDRADRACVRHHRFGAFGHLRRDGVRQTHAHDRTLAERGFDDRLAAMHGSERAHQ